MLKQKLYMLYSHSIEEEQARQVIDRPLMAESAERYLSVIYGVLIAAIDQCNPLAPCPLEIIRHINKPLPK